MNRGYISQIGISGPLVSRLTRVGLIRILDITTFTNKSFENKVERECEIRGLEILILDIPKIDLAY